MTKFWEDCPNCEFSVLCKCPYCEPLLEALKVIENMVMELEGFDLLCIIEDITSIAQAAIKEADNA